MFFRYKVSLTRSHGKIKQAFSKRQKAWLAGKSTHYYICQTFFLMSRGFSYSAAKPPKKKYFLFVPLQNFFRRTFKATSHTWSGHRWLL